jgi:ribonuclease E
LHQDVLPKVGPLPLNDTTLNPEPHQMAKEMLINVSEGEECRIAILQDGKLEELYMERTSSTSHVGNIYKGRVTNVEPSIQAAFVDFGLGRNGFLHISDLQPAYFGRRGEDIQETVGRKMARRDRPPIQRCLRRGDEILVQIIKEGIGTKGPTLSTYLSIPGRILVMMPGMGKMGVSRKIEDEEERRRLRQILDSLKPPKDVGFIIRTAGVEKSKTEIQRDLTYLTRLWQNIEKKQKECPAPVELYTEGDLVTRTVRDVFSTEIDRIVVDNKDVTKRVKEFIKLSLPRAKNKVELHENPLPLFHQAGIEREIEQINSRYVPLPSGGSLVIDSTEAIVAIDVNSGKFRDHNDAEMTAFKTDMEAADEIPRQLKLRDLGGVIICDFIDLRYERHRRELEHKLHENFKEDRAKTKVLRMSQFGIIELTRQRMRPSLKRSIYYDCPHCHGAGLVKTPESMSLDVMRRLAIAANDQRVARVELAVCPDVAFYLNNRKRQQVSQMEADTGKRILIRSNAALGPDEAKLDLYDTRDGLVFIDGLVAPPPATLSGAQPPHHGARPPYPQRQQGRGGRGREDRYVRPGTAPAAPPQGRLSQEQAELAEDRLDREAAEEEDEQPARPSQRQRGDDRGRRGDSGRSSRAVPAEDNGPDMVSGEELEEITDREDEAAETTSAESSDEATDSVESAAPASQSGSDQDQETPAGGRRRRRRGRRGGRGRNRGRANAPQGETRAAAPSASEAISESTEREDEESERPFDEEAASPGAEEASVSEAEEAAEEAVAAPADDESADSGAPEAAAEGEGEAKPRRRRRGRRGGRRRRGRDNKGGQESGGGSTPADTSDTDNGAPANEPDAEEESSPAPSRGQSTARSQPAVAAPVVRTGSTDRHLADDEPVEHEPVHRPRHYRDLDSIPDDLE